MILNWIPFITYFWLMFVFAAVSQWISSRGRLWLFSVAMRFWISHLGHRQVQPFLCWRSGSFLSFWRFHSGWHHANSGRRCCFRRHRRQSDHSGSGNQKTFQSLVRKNNSYLSVCRSVCVSVYLVCLSVCMPICLSVCPSVHLSVLNDNKQYCFFYSVILIFSDCIW